MDKTLYDTIIIGGGPAATAAGVYAARKRLKALVLTDTFGGQSIVSDDVQNWIGEPHISGIELAEKMKAHLKAYPDVLEIIESAAVTKVKPITCSEDRVCDFEVTTPKGTYRGKTLILAAGARRRKLGVPGEKEYDGKGVAYCSTCDAPLFKGKAVAVVGGGNAGLEAVQDLLSYASRITLLIRGEKPSGDAVTLEVIRKNDKVSIITNVEVTEVYGESFLTGAKYKNRQSGEVTDLTIGGLFVEIGSVPNSEFIKEVVDVDKFGQVIIDSKTAATSHPGVFAAGDITDDPFKQNNISAGDAVKAALSAYLYLLKRDKANPAEEVIDR
ncbi:pyridine nucleotide-disulfide oxidoreductase [Candidatus Uhrbacteria bacterium CG10_big_fil_rev_8_21_14_0_10_48_11]|uniref:Pyridine nucleotide-disulfide oxidoreductase n=1 Tax=Candidatus Uhrbacteria bacterium CG10_big_fil_rev_8_21_14_0_10_48_11 TaxID=1975037 RepID=A0A2M8LFQ3_9BACT|nr:MAG: pyridine nucleotide-disulfide oxidoreductase [Candidatus Uhrbacteria bacterium CG10_big_fil_rev_8_21_14_0_10_48_11]